MKNLDLENVWRVCNTLANKMHELSEDNIYINLLGNTYNYVVLSFEEFLDYYSFKIDGNTIEIFNNDRVAYSDYTNEDYSYISTILLSFTPEKLEKWVETEIELQLAKQERQKESDKERLKNDIKRIQKQLDNLQ